MRRVLSLVILKQLACELCWLSKLKGQQVGDQCVAVHEIRLEKIDKTFEDVDVVLT